MSQTFKTYLSILLIYQMCIILKKYEVNVKLSLCMPLRHIGRGGGWVGRAITAIILTSALDGGE